MHNRIAGREFRGALLLAIALSGCLVSSRPGGGGGGPVSGDGCGSDRDCGQASICDKTNDDDDIAPADDEAGVCVALGGCFNDSECPAPTVCDRGSFTCVVDDCLIAANDCLGNDSCVFNDGIGVCGVVVPDRCVVVVDRHVYRAGDDIGVGVFGFDAEDEFVSAVGASVTAVCGSGVCDQVVTGTVAGGADCAVTARVFADDVARRVVVVDEAGVVAGAAVSFDGNVVVTDEGGVALFFDVGSVVEVSADGHEDVVVVGGDFDSVVVVPREAGAGSARVTPDLTKVHAKGDLRLTASLLPLSVDPSRFSLDALFGPSSDVLVDIEGLTTPGGELVSLPDALTLGLGDTDFRGTARVASSTTERLFLGTFATTAQLSQLGGQISAGAVLDRDLLFDLVAGPFGAKGDHGLVVKDAAGAGGLVDVDVVPDTLRMLSETYGDDGTLAVVVVDVPTVGLLPLGFAERGLSPEADGIVDHAPPHDGLEGLPVRVLELRYAARPWSAASAVEARFDGEFVAAADVARVGDRVVVGEHDGVVHVRVVDEDGHAWNLFSSGAADVEAPVGVTTAATVDNGDVGVVFAKDGGLTGVRAVTRVVVP